MRLTKLAEMYRSGLTLTVCAILVGAGCSGGPDGRDLQERPTTPADDADWTLSAEPASLTIFPLEQALVTLTVSRADLYDVEIVPDGKPERAVSLRPGETSRAIALDWLDSPGDHLLRLRATAIGSRKTAETVVRVRQLGDFPGVDTTFGKDGLALGPFAGFFGTPSQLHALADGRLLVAGHGRRALTDESVVFLGALDSTGTPDVTFGDQGLVRLPSRVEDPFRSFRVVGLESDSTGRIVSCLRTDGTSRSLLERYEPDGTLDATFGVDGQIEVDLSASSIALDSGHRILVLGNQPARFGMGQVVLQRFLETGELDTSFGESGSVSRWADSRDGMVRIDPTGRSTAAFCVADECDFARLEPNGRLDAGFGVDGGVRLDVRRHFDLLPGGGYSFFQSYVRSTKGSDREISFTRLRPDGTRDEAFGPGGLQRMELPFKAALSAAQDGVSYVAGVEEPEHVLSHQRWGLARFSPNGALDTSFGRAGLLYTTLRQGDSRAAPWMNRPIAGVVDGDGRLVLAGALADDTDLQMYFVRYR